MESVEEFVFSDVTNDRNDTNKNDNITTRITQLDKVTNIETNPASKRVEWIESVKQLVNSDNNIHNKK